MMQKANISTFLIMKKVPLQALSLKNGLSVFKSTKEITPYVHKVSHSVK